MQSQEILEVLKALVKIPSFTSSSGENDAIDFVYNYLSQKTYFDANPQDLFCIPIEGDSLNRSVCYACLHGLSKKTLVLLAHVDVVGIEDYGDLKPYAFDPDILADKLRRGADEETISDIDSGEWLFGRGIADMKAGLVINLAVLDHFLKKGPGEGTLIFVIVPDEESYSAGMRSVASNLMFLKNVLGYDYRLLINTEPNRVEQDSHVVALGTGGKCLPVVLAQGKKAHVADMYEGLSPLGLLSEFFLRTELNTDLCEKSSDQVNMPPTWLSLRDLKDTYDVSIPEYAAGYLNVLSFKKTPKNILDCLMTLANDAFESYITRLKASYHEYQKLNPNSHKTFSYTPLVMSYESLLLHCQGLSGFDDFYKPLVNQVVSLVKDGSIIYPQATLRLMQSALAFSDITQPVIIIAFSPPYYPAVSSAEDLKDSQITRYFDNLNKWSTSLYQVPLTSEAYSAALSDISYSAIPKYLETDVFINNTPLWQDNCYTINFNAVRNINIPGMIFGPRGKHYHERTERVHKEDVLTRIPDLIIRLTEQIFREKE
jgi:arginine utilization protein RocB